MLINTKKTKIITTIGPVTNELEIMKKLIINGANIFRFNMKHGTIEWHLNSIRLAKKAAKELDAQLGILIDLQGPEIRIKNRDDKKLIFKEGDKVKFGTSFKNKNVQIVIPKELVFKTLRPESLFSIDDGFFPFKVETISDTEMTAIALSDAEFGTNKGMNLFELDIALPSLTDTDLEKLDMAKQEEVDFIALSFVRSKEDIHTLKEEMAKRDINAKIISKVESQKGIDNIDSIIKHSYGIMFARGDLGIEIPVEEVPYLQKIIIQKCRKAYTPVIVATQMLQSMIENPIPTRAEVTDVANAIYTRTDAIMLSGETTAGKYPTKAVKYMTKIAQYNEPRLNFKNFDFELTNRTEAVVEAAHNIIEETKKLQIDKVVVFTESGYTARVLASFRPSVDIIAATSQFKTLGKLTMSYGSDPVLIQTPEDPMLMNPEYIVHELTKTPLVKKGEVVMVVYGQHGIKTGQTNSVSIIKAD
jgi:pyruvate kinase